MEGEVSKKELESVLKQAMFAAKNVRAQHGRLLQFELQLKQVAREKDCAARLEELLTSVVKTLRLGLEAGARYLTRCVEIAAENSTPLALSPSFTAMPDEQLYNALLAQPLPAHPTTQAEAFPSIEAAFYAVKMAREHYLGSCIEHLVTAAPADAAAAGPTQDSGEIVRPDNPVAAVNKKLIWMAASLGRVTNLAELAVKHSDLAVAVLSSFLDPMQVASLAEFTEKHGII